MRASKLPRIATPLLVVVGAATLVVKVVVVLAKAAMEAVRNNVRGQARVRDS